MKSPDPVKDLIEAWTNPGRCPVYHYAMQDRVRKEMPLVADAIERIVKNAEVR